MKNISFLLFMLLSQLVYSQNWAPINTTEKFCYSTDDTLDMINNVLWVDSLSMDGDTILYYFNKIAIPYQNGFGSEFLFNQPQFLLDEVQVYPSGEWVFHDTFFLPIEEIESFMIIPNMQLNDSWDFTDDLTALVSDVGITSIFGQQDSVKTILLSDDSQILLSKNFGIINWRNQYQLIGIEGRDLGVLVPSFDDLFAQISSGDVVCYHNGRWQADETVTGWNTYIRMDIETVSRYEDSIVFHAYVRSNTIYYWKNNSAEENKGYQDIVVYRSRFTDVYPNDTLNVSWEYSPMDNGILISKLARHKWGGIKKTQYLVENDLMGNVSLLYTCEGLYSYELCTSEYSDYLLMEHSVDYGFLEYYDAGFEWGGQETLVGIINDGDTLGIIYPIDLFTGNQELSSASYTTVYPSPAKDHLFIHSLKTGKLKWFIFNISGQVMMQGILEKSRDDVELSISQLPKGIYIIQIEIEGQLSRKKILKE